MRREYWFLLAALILAAGLKVSLLLAGRVPFNSDEAVVALMARHILQGERPIFFYGQAYMGSLDAFLVAAGFGLFGQQVWVIRLVQAALYLLTILTTAWLGKAVYGSLKAGIVAAWLMAIPAVSVTTYTTASLGGYGEALILGNLILIVGLRIAKIVQAGEPQAGGNLGQSASGRGNSEPKVGWLSALWGFVAGFGLWVFGITLVYSLPMGLYLFRIYWLKSRQRGGHPAGKPQALTGRALLPLLSGGLLGAAPWFAFGIQHGFDRLVHDLSGGAIVASNPPPFLVQVAQHLLNFILFGIGAIFGLRPPWNATWLALPLAPLALFFWVAVVVYTVKRWRENASGFGPQAVLAGVILCVIVAFLLTPFGTDPSGRYFLPMAVPLALLAAKMILDLRARTGAWAVARMAVRGLLALVLVYNLWGTVQSALRYPPGITSQFFPLEQVDHRYDQELMDFLRLHGEKRGYTNYWVTFTLAFNSQEELIFSPRLPYHLDFRYLERDNRYPPYDAMVAQADRVAYITTFHPPLDEYLQERFTDLKVSWQEAWVGDYHIYYDLSKPVRPAEIGLGEDNP